MAKGDGVAGKESQQGASDCTLSGPLSLENQICFPLYSAANAVIRGYRPLLEKLSLTYLQYITMMVLWEHDGINVKTLGEMLHLDSGTLTPLLTRLESKGLLQRKRLDTDERVRQIFITKEGAALKAKAMSVPNEMMCKVDMEMDELLQLKSLCESMIKRLA